MYDILRNEKKREDLQKLEETFFIDVVSYLQEKNILLQTKKNDSDIFATGERDKLDYELRSIKRILKEIYEKRERKIIDIALNKSKTGSDIIDTSAMLREEKLFYEEILRSLDTYRSGIIHRLFRAEIPDVTMPSLWRSNHTISYEPTTTQAKPLSSYDSQESDEDTPLPSTHSENHSPPYAAASQINTHNNEPQNPPALSPHDTTKLTPPQNTSSQTSSLTRTKIKFIHATPRFIWKDLKEYGPFDPGESTDIFPEVADLLIRKGRAEKV